MCEKMLHVYFWQLKYDMRCTALDGVDSRVGGIDYHYGDAQRYECVLGENAVFVRNVRVCVIFFYICNYFGFEFSFDVLEMSSSGA